MIRVLGIADEAFSDVRTTSDNNLNHDFIWVNDDSADISLYVDRNIRSVISDYGPRPVYGWLLESRTIIPDVYKYVEDNIETLAAYSEGIFTHDAELAKLHPKLLLTMSNAAPWVVDRKIHSKSKFVSMISSNKSWADGHRHRLSLVDKYRDHVDFYGRGFNTFIYKEEPLKDYMFSIAIENAKYNNYFTEKLTDCFACGTVPVFYGSDAVADDLFDGLGVLKLTDDFNVDQLSVDLYYDMMPHIKNNFEIACEMKTAEDYIAEKYFA